MNLFLIKFHVLLVSKWNVVSRQILGATIKSPVVINAKSKVNKISCCTAATMTHCRKWEHSGGFEEKELRFKKQNSNDDLNKVQNYKFQLNVIRFCKRAPSCMQISSRRTDFYWNWNKKYFKPSKSQSILTCILANSKEKVLLVGLKALTLFVKQYCSWCLLLSSWIMTIKIASRD